MAPGLAGAFGAAVEGPVVEHREFAVGRGMHVELDKVGTGREGALHRGQGVLDLCRDRLADAGRGATVAGQSRAIEILVLTAMRRVSPVCAGASQEAFHK